MHGVQNNTKMYAEFRLLDEYISESYVQSGLTDACLKSEYTREFVSKAVLAYIKRWIPKQRDGVLAGNSIHADRSFLIEEMPEVIDWLHYRWVLSLKLLPTLLTRVLSPGWLVSTVNSHVRNTLLTIP